MELYKAVKNNNIEDVIKLLKMNIDVNYQGDAEYTSLHLACKYGYLDILKILLNNKEINLNLQNTFDMTPLILAASNCKIEIVDYLIKDKRLNLNETDYDGENILQLSFYFFDYDIIIKLIQDNRLNINHQNYYGDTLLHIICSYKYSYIYDLKILLCYERNIDLNIKNYNDKTAEDLALEYNKIAFLNILNQYKQNKEKISKQFRKEFDLKDLNINEKFILFCADSDIIQIKKLLKKKNYK